MIEHYNMVYMFGYSPRLTTHLERLNPLILSQAKKGLKIGLILIHDGVLGAASKGKNIMLIDTLKESEISIFAMIPDLKARGIPLENIDNTIRLLEYNELIDILDDTDKLISWM